MKYATEDGIEDGTTNRENGKQNLIQPPTSDVIFFTKKLHDLLYFLYSINDLFDVPPWSLSTLTLILKLEPHPLF